MAKLYSSLRESDIERFETGIRPGLYEMLEKDLDNEEKVLKEIVDYMKAIHTWDDLGYKIKSTLRDKDDPKVVRWRKQFEIAKAKSDEFKERFGSES